MKTASIKILSQTGCGHVTRRYPDFEVEVFVRSVNHKYLDLSVRLPDIIAKNEAVLVDGLAKRIIRGKVTIDIDLNFPKKSLPEIDHEEIGRFLALAKELAKKYNLPNNLTVRDVIFNRDITYHPRTDFDPKKLDRIKKTISEAVDDFVRSRSREGNALAREIKDRLSMIERVLRQIVSINKKAPALVSRRAKERFAKLDAKETGNGKRMEEEIVFFIDKLDITEEIVRLSAHLKEFRSILASPEFEKAKRIDFLIQEMNREVNTIGSKGSFLQLGIPVVSLKTEIEKIREQIQNII